MTALVELENLGKAFGKHVALRGATGTIEPGEVVGIIGPNGGGKSTLLYLIAGLLLPSEGTVTVDGVPASDVAKTAAGKIGLVTARPGLYPLLTGTENLDYFASLFGLDAPTIESRSGPLLETFELGDAMDRRLGTWSTGMKQRLSLIRALITSPSLLLFDEPTANLDPIGERQLHAELRRQADDGLACVLVTHRLHQAQSVCDRVWFVDGTIKNEVELERMPFEAPTGPLFELWERTS